MHRPCARARTLRRARTLMLPAVTALLLAAGATAAHAADGPGGASAPAADDPPATRSTHATTQEIRLSRARVREVQRHLKLRPDGTMDAQTRRALRRYQRDNALAATGRLTLQTLRHLRGAGPKGAPTPDPAGAVIAAAARRRIGAAYRTGATGPAAYDCSGLTVEAYEAAGIDLARTSFDQFEQGAAVQRADIQAGDLVFFDAAGPGASHVGIATGPNTVISATTSRGVIEHRLTSSYWSSHYLGARRLT